MSNKTRRANVDPTIQAANTSSRRALIGVIVAAVIAAVGGTIVAIINRSDRAKPPSTSTAIFRLRVTVVDPQGTPIEDARVWSSFGGEAKKVAGGWQFDIPEASKPSDGKLSIFAAKESAFLKGEESLTLGKDMNPAITVRLQRDTSAKVRGQIIDERNRGVTGARVFVVGYEAEAVITKEGGNFELPAHAAIDQMVMIHAEKTGFRGAALWHPAGDAPLIMRLER